MKPKQLPLVVLDTCCYLHFLMNDEPAYAQTVEEIIDQHQKLHIVVIPTSVELETFGVFKNGVGGKYGNKPNQRKRRVACAREWFSSQQFMPAELDSLVTNTAIRLMAESNLKGMDAVVIATGIVHEATTVFTYDTQMLRAGDDIEELEIRKPPPPGTLFPLPSTE